MPAIADRARGATYIHRRDLGWTRPAAIAATVAIHPFWDSIVPKRQLERIIRPMSRDAARALRDLDENTGFPISQIKLLEYAGLAESFGEFEYKDIWLQARLGRVWTLGPLLEQAVVFLDAQVASTVAGADPRAAPSATDGRWTASHSIPDSGLLAWPVSNPATAQAVTLEAGLEVCVAEYQGNWAHIRCLNGWEGWTDALELVPNLP